MDDEISGWTVRNNTFTDCQTAMLLGGGRDAIIKDNRVENCSLGLEFDKPVASCFKQRHELGERVQLPAGHCGAAQDAGGARWRRLQAALA